MPLPIIKNITMDFNQLVNEKLNPLFFKHGFRETEKGYNWIKFFSACNEVVISYNSSDKQCLVEAGKKDEILYPLNQKAIKAVFGLDVEIDDVQKEVFIENIVFFFQYGGILLLFCQNGKLTELSSFIENESKNYTAGLFKRKS